MSEVLDRWNRLSAEEAAQDILACCGSAAWAHALAARRPLADEASLVALSDEVWSRLRTEDWMDVRDTNFQRRDQVLRALDDAGRAISTKRRVEIRSELLNADAPAECDSAIVAALRQACEKHKFSFLPMTSRAYHDSLFISRIALVAMLFIPCRTGYSHRPDEYASPEDIARGSLVLAEALAKLAA